MITCSAALSLVTGIYVFARRHKIETREETLIRQDTTIGWLTVSIFFSLASYVTGMG